MSNSVDDLRAHLFATIEGLRSGKVDTDQARAISEVAQTIINSARVEVDAAKLSGSQQAPQFLAPPKVLPPGITGIVQHRLAG